jgi:hypothetical protein
MPLAWKATHRGTLLALSIAAVLGLPGPGQTAPLAKTSLKTIPLTSDAWRNAPVSPVSSVEIDGLVERELQANNIPPAPLTTDEQFIRRVTLDLVGKLPGPAEVRAFVAERDADKRAKLIDKLLDSEDFAKHWARYWRDVIAAKVTDRRGLALSRGFESWMTEQLKANKSWADVARTLLTAEGGYKFSELDKNGEAFFLMAHTGPDAANDRAAEVSRVFLGIQLRCAQCHDHPFDQWKQVQFHELAAYFARLRERPVFEDKRIAGFQLVSLPRGEHEMAVKNDPNQKQTTYPRFLDGKDTGKDLSDKDRRKALADAVVSRNNYWFAGAHVNRIWGTLMGQSFSEPVDDMGPERPVVFGNVLVRLASSFRATDYNMKALFRVIANTKTYQRQVRPGASSEEHLLFSAAYPARLRPDALWASLTMALGQIASPPREGRGMGPFAMMLGRQGFLAFQFQQLFDFDPSLKPDEVESTIAQVLMLMNNPNINQKVAAKGETTLAQILKDHPQDDDAALKALYQRTLARQPTAKELEKCRAYIKKVGNRAEAFEDVQWTLINSTEFQTKR